MKIACWCGSHYPSVTRGCRTTRAWDLGHLGGAREVGTDRFAPALLPPPSSPSFSCESPQPSSHLVPVGPVWFQSSHFLLPSLAPLPLSLQQVLRPECGWVIPQPPGCYSGCPRPPTLPPPPGVPRALVAPTHILPGLAQASRSPLAPPPGPLASSGAASSAGAVRGSSSTRPPWGVLGKMGKRCVHLEGVLSKEKGPRATSRGPRPQGQTWERVGVPSDDGTGEEAGN